MYENFHTSPVVNYLWKVISLNLTLSIKIDWHNPFVKHSLPRFKRHDGKGYKIDRKNFCKKFT